MSCAQYAEKARAYRKIALNRNLGVQSANGSALLRLRQSTALEKIA
jgi:hypothetical protein